MAIITEGEILSIAGTDKKKAFELAFSRYWEILYVHACKKVQSEEIAKDLVQEVFIVFWNNLENLGANKQFVPYLFTVLRNKILKLFERDEVRLRYALHASGLGGQEEASSHNLLVEKELQKIITDEVARMPNRMREIYLLKKDAQLSITEISLQLSLSQQTVKNQLQNAAQRLKTRVRSYDSSLILMALLVFGMAAALIF